MLSEDRTGNWHLLNTCCGRDTFYTSSCWQFSQQPLMWEPLSPLCRKQRHSEVKPLDQVSYCQWIGTWMSIQDVFTHVPGEGGVSEGQVLRAEPKKAGLQGLEEREGHVLWLRSGREPGRLCPPSKPQQCPGQLELGQPGMKPCLLLNKDWGLGLKEGELWVASRTWFDLKRIGRVPEAQKHFLPQVPEIPPVPAPENLAELLHCLC